MYKIEQDVANFHRLKAVYFQIPTEEKQRHIISNNVSEKFEAKITFNTKLK